MSDLNRFSFVDSTRFFIIKDYNSVYTEIPKVASTSFKVWITDLLNIEFDKKNWEYIHELDLPMKVGYKMLNQFPDYFKFCFIRNPGKDFPIDGTSSNPDKRSLSQRNFNYKF
ncbi:MAG: sulfotransferase family 2 domain-containing protein [Ignavibacteria bacterium]|nr:sulfotransferase family 2 domain-containing protein [Ignavibacteria bacterium]